jgi:phenylpropionate dioxygenase-like ring-hydroxylating dioxygenase large terminal subunit
MVSQSGYPAAPIDQAALARSLRAFGESVMLPRDAYVDPAVFTWEQKHFFGAGWSCVGFSSQLAQPGDQRAESVGAGGVLLTRDDDGALHAFANTCRHRGHELLPCGTSAQRNTVICPYHSWTYELSGGLRFAQGFKGRDGFDQSAWGLAELPVVDWHGLIFVDGSGQAPPLTDSLRVLEELVAPYEPERLVVGGRHEYDAAANWKILTENYHECYHCPVIHPELCRVSPPKSGANYPAQGAWVGGWMDLRDGMDTMSLDGTSLGVPLRGLDATGLRTVIYVNIFPNVLLSLHPDYVMTHRLVPLAVDRTMIECTWTFAPEAADRPDFDPGYAVEFWDITNQQDWHACESVQRGLTSAHAQPGPLSPDEDAVYQFVTMVARGYRGQPVWNPGVKAPAAG